MEILVSRLVVLIRISAAASRETHNPSKGTIMMKVTLSQLTCLYQFLSVMGCSVM